MWACARRSQLLPDGGGEAETNHLVNPLRDALESASVDRLLNRDAQARIAWNDNYEELSDGRLAQDQRKKPATTAVYLRSWNQDRKRVPETASQFQRN